MGDARAEEHDLHPRVWERDFTSHVGRGSVAGSDACLIFRPKIWGEHSSLTSLWPRAAAGVRVRCVVSLGLEVRQVNRTGREDKGAEEGDVERKEREAGGRKRSEEDPDEGPGVGGRAGVPSGDLLGSGDPVWVLEKPSKNCEVIVPRTETLADTEKDKKQQKSPVILSVKSVRS